MAARALDAWMTVAGMDGDFTACDAGVLNRFFRDYHAGHRQNGTNTKQRNLRHLFTWLDAMYDHPHPYTDELNRYAPVNTFADLINRAKTEGLIGDEAQEVLHAGRVFRNHEMHATTASVFNPAIAAGMIATSHKLVAELFDASS